MTATGGGGGSGWDLLRSQGGVERRPFPSGSGAELKCVAVSSSTVASTVTTLNASLRSQFSSEVPENNHQEEHNSLDVSSLKKKKKKDRTEDIMRGSPKKRKEKKKREEKQLPEDAGAAEIKLEPEGCSQQRGDWVVFFKYGGTRSP